MNFLLVPVGRRKIAEGSIRSRILKVATVALRNVDDGIAEGSIRSRILKVGDSESLLDNRSGRHVVIIAEGSVYTAILPRKEKKRKEEMVVLWQ